MKNTPYLRSKSKYFRKYIIVFIILFIMLCVFGCSPRQEPSQTVINYTDNSQIVQVVGDNNQMDATSDVQAAEQSATPTQTTENTTKDNTLIFLIIAGIILGVGIYLYQKKRIL